MRPSEGDRQPPRVQGDRRRSQRLGEIEPAVKNLITLAESGADPQSVVPRLKELEAYKTKTKTRDRDPPPGSNPGFKSQLLRSIIIEHG
jgi:hypothetical protein